MRPIEVVPKDRLVFHTKPMVRLHSLDPCVYRRANGNVTDGLAFLHVDDILVTGAMAGIEPFGKAIGNFQNTGMNFLSDKNDRNYIGLDLAARANDIRTHQTKYIEKSPPSTKTTYS